MVGGLGTAWLATEAGLYERVTDGVGLIGVFYVVGLCVALGLYHLQTRRRSPRPTGVPAEPGLPEAYRAPASVGPPPVLDAAWRAARLANLREERRQATRGGEPIGLSWSSPLVRAWSVCIVGLVFPGFATLLVALGDRSDGDGAAGAVAMVAAFWLLWSLTLVWIVRATRQRSRVQRQRGEVEELATRVGWQVGQGLGPLVRWLDAYWEASIDHSLLRPAPHHWCAHGAYHGFPVLFDLSPVGAPHSVPRFLAVLAAHPPTGTSSTEWVGAGSPTPTPQLAWLRELGLRVEHSEAGLLAIGDRSFVRDFELDSGSVTRLSEIARVMAEHARVLGAAPRSQLP